MSNTREPSVCHGDDSTKDMGMVHKGGLGEGKGVHNMRYDLCSIEAAAGEKNRRL